MPKALEQALMKSFAKRKKIGKLRGVSEDQYVYGAMRKAGWKTKREMKNG